MNAVRLWIGIVGALLVLAGCDRGAKKDSSSIVIQAPNAGNPYTKTGGVGALAAMPTDRKVCYGVNVTAPDIAVTAPNECSFRAGLLAGFVEPGATVELSVPKGSGRKVELYAFLQAVGENLPCPVLGPTLPADKLVSTYLVGVAEGINLQGDQVSVSIHASFPGLSQNIAQTLTFPSSCTAGAAPSAAHRSYFVSAATGTATGTGLKLKYRAGGFPGHQVLSGSGIKLIVK